MKASFWILSLLICLSFAFSASLNKLDTEDGVVAFSFHVHRGNTLEDATRYNRPYLSKRSNEDGTLSSTILNEQSFYLANISVGSSQQQIGVLLDTGSADMWLMSQSNPYCDSTVDCNKYGTFNESNSTTFESNNTDFSIGYVDHRFATGEWGHDDITINGVTVNQQSFAVANKSNSSISVLGIGFAGLESTNDPTNGYTYANLPIKMVEQGIIKKSVYSLYLNSSQVSTGNILFGGVDHEKYTGSLQTVEIVNTDSDSSKPITVAVTLSSISVGSNVVTSQTSAALLDSGTTAIYAPSAVFTALGEALGASYSSALGAYTFNCIDESNDTAVTFDFTGAQINVTLYELQIDVSELSSSVSDANGSCAISIFKSSDSSYILGDVFLTSAYVVYDLENYQVSLAQSNQNSTETNIEVIQSTVPSASTAKYYSSTWSGSSSSSSSSSSASTS
ncbi:hypothetical protein PACTADRAFT_3836 [Pachysolen tannophilus NRRL Y-2460]|uniref:candidapepsin n=1 Tax=Pachysolen tannophilus NRRL Y-2460 TaxID=669874 RepID=A0A1E4TT73_PACTA|nr:hypothetical protein PACTADRAFT_3836 [Pachysolen tannophilus NRRL Y-2460]